MDKIEFSTLMEEDRVSVFDLLQDPVAMKYLGPRRPLTDIEAEKWFQSECHYPTRLIFRDSLTKELIGFCGIKDIDGDLDFGYFLRKQFWGKGYAKQMCQMAVSRLAPVTDFSKVRVFIASENIASQRIAQSLCWTKKSASSNEYEAGHLYEICT